MLAIEPMFESHWPDVYKIYQEGLDIGTFENEVPSWQEFDKKHHNHSRFVSIQDNVIAGWAGIQPVSNREAYKGVAEVSVYVSKSFRGRGIGKALLSSLIHSSEKEGIWTLNAVILKINRISINLHQSLGFRIVGYRERISQKNGVWMDTILMERRSKIVGV